ncbi:hypothetical protein INT08_01780 [Prosthecochloris sp. N3]|uniref:Uncharacterized protein n=1 Tax=Prosthecochloris ethylica TaxID=2743976 RepID=A0ABR9XPK8_9CHLB|nr:MULTISPECIES: hypothetical protein [Prosthecochloris]MEC9487640.1 hypothetical protein [Prosthecochloris sp.]MBF0586208.1 hypothetical protein [Prosthecochloris ethylica]MBF0635914.1 hypothetical protein [Prosthecochloris ethylica]NUK47411.1 hypothetical protein [Prosthecochloris ethylica]RNA64961.1 hypothetical protein CR163_006800 [Prosthecochloris sp. ZM_2]
MKQSLTFLKQFSFVLLLLAGLSACGGQQSDPLKAEIEEGMQMISDQLTGLKAVKMQQESVVDGLEEDLKWEYSPEFEKAVKAYVAEVDHLMENISELNSIYDELASYQEKLEKGAPLEYSHTLIEEMATEKIERAEEILENNEEIQDKLYDLSDQLDEL